jgi:hypothetical protein
VSPDMELGNVLRRIASATSVIRTRTQDAERLAVHGGLNGEHADRVRELVVRLEVVAEQLEQAVA